MMSARRLLRVGVILGMALSLFGQNKIPSGPDQKLVESELALAIRPISYMVINLRAKTIALKARGMTLKTWPIASWKIWGKSVPANALALKKKSALKNPKRTNITPGKEGGAKKDTNTGKDALDLGVLELKDMPVHFSLDFGNGIAVSVRPKTTRFWPTLVNVWKGVSRTISNPLKTVWVVFRRKSFTQIDLVLPNEKDAKSLYWAFLDGHNTIIYK
jgi:hypothetical protein